MAGLRIGWFDPVAQISELPNYSAGALIPGLFADCWAPFFVASSLIQDQPDQMTLSMRNDPDGLIMAEARDRAAIDDLEDAFFDFYGGVRSLIE